MTLSSPISQTKQKPLISSFKFQVSSFNNRRNSLSSLNCHSLQPNPKCQSHTLSPSSFVITTPHLSFIALSLTTTTFPLQVLSLNFQPGQVRGDPLTLTEEIQMGCHFSVHSLPSSPVTLHNQPTMEEGHCLLLSSQLVSPCVSFLYKFRKRVSFTLYFCNLIIWVFKVFFFFG